MTMSKLVSVVGALVVVLGCVSEAVQREYNEWRCSADNEPGVDVGEFEAKYMQGWRERAAAKDEYNEWKDSSDGDSSVSLVRFEREYKAGWRQRAARKAEYNEWKQSADGVDSVSMSEFFAKHKEGWRERAQKKRQAQIAKEAKERAEREAKEAKEREIARRKEALDRLRGVRSKLVSGEAESWLKAIRNAYANGKKCGCPFPRKTQGDDWLKTWTEPRLELSEEDKLAGEALLAEFGAKCMPKAFASYEKARDAAKELQQVFNEEFPEPWKINSASPKWKSFNKVLEKFAKLRTEYFMCHDELCHYWNALKLGSMTATEISNADADVLGVQLMPENYKRAGYHPFEHKPLEPKLSDFASKYTPETFALYQKFEREYKENDALMMEAFRQHQQMDDVRYDRSFDATVQKNNELARKMKMLSACLLAWHTDHRIMEKSSEDVAKLDQEMMSNLKLFANTLSDFIRRRATGPIIPDEDFVKLPFTSVIVHERKDLKGRGWTDVDTMFRITCSIMKFEVTQFQWMYVMGKNPSKYVGPDRPVDNISWKDCQCYLRRIKEMYGVRFRLPYAHEWAHACRAGGKGKWGMRVNGEEGPADVMGVYKEHKLNNGTIPVGMLEPNAWGLYDMHGNVWERCEALESDKPFGLAEDVARGGDWNTYMEHCGADCRGRDYVPGRWSDHDFGVRLVREQ